jgi:hypothetical protein
MRFPSAIFLLALCLGPALHAAEINPQLQADEQTLRAARVGVNGPALVDFFRKRTPSPEDIARLARNVRRLGDVRYKVRKQATADLIRAGRPAIPFLREAARDADIEVANRARLCLKRIQQGNDSLLVMAAARLLADRKPAAAAEVLLAYILFAEDEDVALQVQAALNAVALREGKPDALVVKALEDPSAKKRAAAAEALIRAVPAGRRPGFLKMLEDPDKMVRLRSALAFLELHEKKAVPVLIALVGELPRDDLWRAEDVLFQLAGDQVPKAAADPDTAPARRSAAWAAWWRKYGGKIDLAKRASARPTLGFSLAVLESSVAEYGADGKLRWQLTGLSSPRDAEVLPGNRVLVAEESGGRVTERDLKGKVLWEKRVASPIACRRLPNGNTFIGTRNQLLVVDRAGKEVFRYRDSKGRMIASANRFRNGQMAVVFYDFKTCVRLDATGKELQTVGVSFYSVIGGVDLLPNRHLLVPEYNQNRIAEYDADGKCVRSIAIPQPTDVIQLPNGNYLVASWIRKWVRVIDRKGKVVKEIKLDGMPNRIRRR